MNIENIKEGCYGVRKCGSIKERVYVIKKISEKSRVVIKDTFDNVLKIKPSEMIKIFE